MGASRVMLALLREQPIGGATADALHPSDNIVMKMCDVKLQLKDVQRLAPSGGVLAGACREVKGDTSSPLLHYCSIRHSFIHVVSATEVSHRTYFPPFSHCPLCSVSPKCSHIINNQGSYASWKTWKNTGIW